MSVEEEFEKWFKPYLRANYLVEVDYGRTDLPKSIARQCAEEAYKAGRADERKRCVEIARTWADDEDTIVPEFQCLGFQALAKAIERQEGML